MICVVLGDSIAHFMHPAMAECAEHSVGGISSPDYAARFVHRITADLIVISLGANDHHGGTLPALRLVRSRVSGRVVWLLPNISRQETLQAIRTVAAAYGDRVVDTRPYCAPRLHPTPEQAAGIAGAIRATHPVQ